jgi:hypothetical protein
MNRNATCEIEHVRDGKQYWERISVEEALGFDRSEKKRCPECHGRVRLHRTGNVKSSPAHFEHLKRHGGCSHSMEYDGVSRPHPDALD